MKPLNEAPKRKVGRPPNDPPGRKPRPKRLKPDGTPHRAKATKEQMRQRITELLRIKLDGAEFWDVVEYVKEKEAEAGSAWERKPDEPPMAENTIWWYIAEVNKEIEANEKKQRRREIAHHCARRRHMYGKAMLAGDMATALKIDRDLAELRGLYKKRDAAAAKAAEAASKAGQINNTIIITTPEAIANRIAPYADILNLMAIAGPGGAVRPNDSGQPLDSPQAQPQASPLPAS